MDISEQMKIFREFFEENYYEEILEASRINKRFLVVDFSQLSEFNIELAESLLEEPAETTKVAETAIEELNVEKEILKLRIRFENLPEKQTILISDIRSENIGKFYYIDGIVRKKTDVRPQVINAKFECPSCGNIISVLQNDDNFREPTRCTCGRKGKFRLISKEMIDAQRIILEEIPETLKGGAQPKQIGAILKEDLVSPTSEKSTNPGTKIRIIGFVKEIPIITKTGSKSTRFDLVIETNNVKPIDESFGELIIEEEELIQIKELSKDELVVPKLVKSLAPSTYGHDQIKEALLLQLFGGCRKERDDGIKMRGDMHVLLIGDPGSGKSQLLKRMQKVAPKARYVSGKGISGAGLTATLVKDDFLGGWALEAGALVLANKGFVMIDEMDKMSNEDRSAMHEALEQQTVSISKANIQATLKSETTVLAAANPKMGRFDPDQLVAKQINLPTTLINRFDLIFPIKDLPDKIKDEKMAKFILNRHKSLKANEADIPTELLGKKFLTQDKTFFQK